MGIDWTVNASDVAIFVGGVVAFLKTFLSLRDGMRDMSAKIGSKDPPEGLLGEVHYLSTEVRDHRDQLIALRSRRER
jgi:hypothetical protein